MVDKKKRVRKVYAHVLTAQERFALQSVQRAQSTLRAVNDAIKSGQPVNSEVVSLCFQLGQASATMLFSQA